MAVFEYLSPNLRSIAGNLLTIWFSFVPIYKNYIHFVNINFQVRGSAEEAKEEPSEVSSLVLLFMKKISTLCMKEDSILLDC